MKRRYSKVLQKNSIKEVGWKTDFFIWQKWINTLLRCSISGRQTARNTGSLAPTHARLACIPVFACLFIAKRIENACAAIPCLSIFCSMLQPPQILSASRLKPVLPCSIAAAAADCPDGQKKKEDKKQAFYQENIFSAFQRSHYNGFTQKYKGKTSTADAVPLYFIASPLFNACEKQKKISAGRELTHKGSTLITHGNLASGDEPRQAYLLKKECYL